MSSAREPVKEDPCIVVVDDDMMFRETLGQNLRDAGYQVQIFDGGPRLFSYLSNGGEVDLLLLDWRMPEMNGLEVLRKLRDDGVPAPAIFLTSLSDPIYEESALVSGAVDFVEKSRSFSILLKRIQLIFAGRKGGAGSASEEGGEGGAGRTQGVMRLGDLELNLDSSRAFWKGQRVALSLTEFRLVQHLVDHVGRDVTYRELYDLVHGKGFVAGSGPDGYRANVRTFLKRIRQKFRDLDDTFDQIENYPGFGYRWRDTEGAAA
mgnify:CR=1 FL=1